MGSSQAIRNVLIIGASGKLGPTIVKAFLAADDFKLSITSRSPSSGRFGPQVTEIQTDYSPESLKSAFQSQDAIVCCLGGAAAHLQGTIIEVASASPNIKRFIPSEFGVDSLNEGVRQRLPMLNGKAAIISQLQKANKANSTFTWTALYVGALFDLVLANAFIGLNIDSKEAIIYDGGDTKFPATSMVVVGEALVEILKKPEETTNKAVYFKELWTTSNEMLAALRKLDAPKEWTAIKDTSEHALAEGRRQLAEKNMPVALSLIMRSIYFDKSLQSAASWESQKEPDVLSTVRRRNTTELVAATLKERTSKA